MQLFISPEALEDIKKWGGYVPNWRILDWNQNWEPIIYDAEFSKQQHTSITKKYILKPDFNLYGKQKDEEYIAGTIHPIEWFSMLSFRGEAWQLVTKLYYEKDLAVYCVRSQQDNQTTIVFANNDGKLQQFTHLGLTIDSLREAYERFT